MTQASTAYLAAPGFVDEVIDEVGEVVAIYDRLIIAAGSPRPSAWAQNIWLDPVRLSITSIRDAGRQLRAIQRDWALYSHDFHRRAALIAADLPKLKVGPVVFGDPRPERRLGSWTLLDANTLLASPNCTSSFPNGEVQFVENKEAPPNRAYLKLWELLTITGNLPRPGDRCIDLGASPGGWTWVLASLGAHVLAVDKAPLAPSIAAMPNVTFETGSAFGIDPARFGGVVDGRGRAPVDRSGTHEGRSLEASAGSEPPPPATPHPARLDWMFCDVACYPERLLTLVDRWIQASAVRNMVCTIKCQGATDHAMIRRFAEIPGARVMHLWHNKHELTWVWAARA